MQYFTPDLWSMLNSFSQVERAAANEEWDKRYQAYSQRFTKVLERLPKAVSGYYASRSFHDFNLLKLEVVEEQKKYTKVPSIYLYLTDYTSTYLLKYSNPIEFSVAYSKAVRGFDDLGYEELLDVDADSLSHEILFASGATIFIRFSDKSISLKKMKYSP